MKAIHSGQHIPFREFLNQTGSEFKDNQGDRVYINYAQSWGFVHFLMHSKMKSQGRKMLKKYFTILREGGSWREAHKATFGKLNHEKAERFWIQYMKKL